MWSLMQVHGSVPLTPARPGKGAEGQAQMRT